MRPLTTAPLLTLLLLATSNISTLTEAKFLHGQVNMGIVDVNTAGTGPKYSRQDELNDIKKKSEESDKHMWQTLTDSREKDLQKLDEMRTRELEKDVKEVIAYTSLCFMILFTLWCICKCSGSNKEKRRYRHKELDSSLDTPHSTQVSF